ncbi:MAG: hypothetical protein WBC82_08605 [Dehalococcoidia bacterium]
MQINYEQLSGDEEMVGISGESHNFVEPAIVVFSEPRHFLYAYYIDLLIAPCHPDIMDLPSLLGRDILDRWRMTYNPQKKQLLFKIILADATVPLS